MKILYFINRLSLSGGTLMMAKHVHALRCMGHDASLACLAQDDEYNFRTPLVRCSSTEDLAALYPDLTVACQPQDLIAVRRHVKKAVFLVQDRPIQKLDNYYAAKKKYFRYYGPIGTLVLKIRRFRDERLLSSVFSANQPVWCISPVIAEELRQWKNINSSIIRNAIDPSWFSEAPRGKPCRIVCIGDPKVQVKNMERAMKALQRLKQQRTVHVTHISSGGILPEALARAADEHLVNLPHEEVLSICRQSHILFSPSLSEGFGLPAVEGMACGMLCVLSDIEAYRSFHKGNSNAVEPYALYFNPQDIDDMVRALDTACTNFATPAMTALREHGQRVATWYSEEGMKHDLEAALKTLRAS